MDDPQPEILVGAPLFLRVAEQRLGLRARVEVRARTRRAGRRRGSRGCPRRARGSPRRTARRCRRASAAQTLEISPASSVDPRHDAREVEPFRRGMVVAADGAEPVDRRRAGRARRVRVARAAGRRVAQLETELPGDRDRQRGEPRAALLASPSVGASRCRRPRRVTPSTPWSRQIRVDLGLGLLEGARARGERRSTCSTHRSATTFVRVPPRATPTFTVTPGHRPFSACSATVAFAAASTAFAPFSGSTPAWAARPDELDRVVGDALARAHDVAVGPRALQHERRVVRGSELADHRPRERRADLLVGIADVGDAAERVEPGAPAAPPPHGSR